MLVYMTPGDGAVVRYRSAFGMYAVTLGALHTPRKPAGECTGASGIHRMAADLSRGQPLYADLCLHLYHSKARPAC